MMVIVDNLKGDTYLNPLQECDDPMVTVGLEIDDDFLDVLVFYDVRVRQFLNGRFPIPWINKLSRKFTYSFKRTNLEELRQRFVRECIFQTAVI